MSRSIFLQRYRIDGVGGDARGQRPHERAPIRTWLSSAHHHFSVCRPWGAHIQLYAAAPMRSIAPAGPYGDTLETAKREPWGTHSRPPHRRRLLALAPSFFL